MNKLIMDKFKSEIIKQVCDVFRTDSMHVLNAIELPKNTTHGDLSVSMSRLRLGSNPVQSAIDLCSKFEPGDLLLSCKNTGPFVNWKINKSKLIEFTLREIYQKKLTYGYNSSGQNKKVIVEYSSPNIAKPFHAGHLRSTIIGNFMKNVLTANGYNVHSMNYLGDWGKQYGLLAIAYEKYGDPEELEKDPINHLFKLYVRINAEADKDPGIHDIAREYFKKLEGGDPKIVSLWSKFRELSIEKYKETYLRLNINFDEYSGESQVSKYMDKAFQMLQEKGLLVDSEGAKIIDLEKYKLGKVIVQKKDGTTLYVTRDIGSAMMRYEKHCFDSMYYVVASQQDFYFKQLFKILELMGFEWASRCVHINFGLVEGMSTRKGTVVFLNEILDQTKEKMHQVMKGNEEKYKQIEDSEEVADKVGLSAILVQDMSAKRIKNYSFNWERMFLFEGDTGPYLQYAHARLCSIQRKSDIEIDDAVEYSKLSEEECEKLCILLSQYGDLVQSIVGKQFEPCNVVVYALKLSHQISACFEKIWVMNAEPETAKARLFMYHCARIVLGNALRLIGLVPLERM